MLYGLTETSLGESASMYEFVNWYAGESNEDSARCLRIVAKCFLLNPDSSRFQLE
jgi:hypothetical protein